MRPILRSQTARRFPSSIRKPPPRRGSRSRAAPEAARAPWLAALGRHRPLSPWNGRTVHGEQGRVNATVASRPLGSSCVPCWLVMIIKRMPLAGWSWSSEKPQFGGSLEIQPQTRPMGLTYLPVQLGWSMVGRVIDPSPVPWSVWVLPVLWFVLKCSSPALTSLILAVNKVT